MMEHQTECRHAISPWPATWNETRRFLDTWHFHISEDGYIHVQPQTVNLSLPEIRDFLRRLDLVCNEAFPRMVVFDFSRRAFQQSAWDACGSALCDFALRINAIPVFEHRGDCAAVVTLIRRVRQRQAAALEEPCSP